MLTDTDKQRLQELIQSKLDATLPMATDSPTRMADLQCAACGAFVTFDGAEIKSSEFALVCRACAAVPPPRRTPVKLLRMPMFYVALMTIWGVSLWAVGWGNNSVSATKTKDLNREWFEKRYTGNLVLQVTRATTRADYLKRQGDDDEATRWYKLARTAALKAADDWADTPTEPIMRFIAARRAMQAGDAKTAYAEILPLSNRLGVGDDDVAFRYHRGLCALDAGHEDEARKDLDHFLEANDGGMMEMDRTFGKMVDQMIERAEKGVDSKKNLMIRLRGIAQLEMTRADMIHGVVDAYVHHGVDHNDLDYWKRQMGVDEPDVVETDGTRGPAAFEEVMEEEE